MKKDPARERLKQLGASDAVVRGGLQGLVNKWDAISKEIARGYGLDHDSYLNDVDVRQLIEEVTAVTADIPSSLLKRIHEADELTKRSTVSSKCVWGEDIARKEGWTSKKNWWYFVVPKEMSDTL
jgi:hypothetical protein